MRHQATAARARDNGHGRAPSRVGFGPSHTKPPLAPRAFTDRAAIGSRTIFLGERRVKLATRGAAPGQSVRMTKPKMAGPLAKTAASRAAAWPNRQQNLNSAAPHPSGVGWHGLCCYAFNILLSDCRLDVINHEIRRG
jgi:hypothetical protein